MSSISAAKSPKDAMPKCATEVLQGGLFSNIDNAKVGGAGAPGREVVRCMHVYRYV